MSRASADAAVVRPASRAAGRITVPGDKSISHRYALLAALADGSSTILGYLQGSDCVATLGCLRALGVAIAGPTDGVVTVVGRGLRGLSAPAGPLDAANSGTTMRLLAGVVAAHPFRSVIGGDGSLSRRPMRRVIAPLTSMGAVIEAVDGRPPLTIDGAALRGITCRPEVPSAQVKSAVLLAGLQADGVTTVVEPIATRDHTERAFHAFGVEVERAADRISVQAGQRLQARELEVPGDVSSATFWIALAGGTERADIEIDGVGLNPTRTAVFAVARRAGVDIDALVDREGAGEPVGRLRLRHASPRSFEITPDEVPGLIDEIPALAAMAAMMPAGAELLVRGAAELRVKESDRISALAGGFRALGAQVDEYPDGFRLVSRPLVGATVDAAGDHRLAMSFALAATRAAGATTILGASSVEVSYPGFFETLDRLTR